MPDKKVDDVVELLEEYAGNPQEYDVYKVAAEIREKIAAEIFDNLNSKVLRDLDLIVGLLKQEKESKESVTRDLKEWEMICPVCLGDCRMDKHFAQTFVNRCLRCNGTGIVDNYKIRREVNAQ